MAAAIAVCDAMEASRVGVSTEVRSLQEWAAV
jgi:hypothetical protein